MNVAAERAKEVVVGFFDRRSEPNKKNVTPFRTDSGALWGIAIDGGGPDQRQGILGIQRAFGILGQAELGEGLESPRQTGVAIREIHELPKSFRSHYDIPSGMESLSFGFDVPDDLNLNKGSVQAFWNKNGFALVSKSDREHRLIRTLTEAFTEQDIAIFLSDKKGASGNQSLGIFIPSMMPDSFLKDLVARDEREVKARHESLAYNSDWKGVSVLDSKDGKRPQEKVANDVSAAA